MMRAWLLECVCVCVCVCGPTVYSCNDINMSKTSPKGSIQCGGHAASLCSNVCSTFSGSLYSIWPLPPLGDINCQIGLSLSFYRDLLNSQTLGCKLFALLIYLFSFYNLWYFSEQESINKCFRSSQCKL